MSLRRILCGASAFGALIVGAAWATSASADTPTTPTAVGEVTVTGSFIRGTPEDAAIPVQVIGHQELERQGSPSVLDIIKTLPIIGPVLGDTNQFSTAAQGRNGGGTINLRGLGAQRTLVLLNGRRFGGYTADTNLLPISAIGRVEILKDGAAATYGSDAIGGVANFITRTDVHGLEVSADFRWIDGSEGDYTGSALYGWSNDRMNVLLAAGYQHRSELRTTARQFSDVRPGGGDFYLTNPSGWSSYSNPGAWLITNAAGTPLAGVTRDANCTAVGGFAGFTGATPVCYWTYVPFDNLVEDQNQLQVYGEVNYHITDTTRFHAEVMYAETDQPHVPTSPGYPPFSGVAGPSVTGTFTVPSSNPGFNTFLTQTGNAGLIGVATRATEILWRPLSNGGNPNFLPGRGSQNFYRYYETWHAAAELRGELGFGGIGYDASLTYIQENQDQRTSDILITRLQAALNGLGGPACTGVTPGANGCLYFNPFSNGFAGNPTLGLTNPGFNAAAGNSPDLTRWLFNTQVYEAWQTTWVANLVFNGQLGWRLPGGEIGWAAGAQYRTIDVKQRVSPNTYDADAFPCPTAGQVVGPPPGCPVATGPFIFLGQNRNLNLSQNIWAAYGELHLPITDTIDAQLAVRYERYSGNTGSTTNPQFRIKWQALDWFALRASVGTSFRGPSAFNTIPTGATGLAGLPTTGNAFRAVDFIGNPNVGPETALTYSVGAIFRAGGLTATVDYWKYRLEDQITSVPAALIASAVAGVGTGTQLVNCAHPLVGLGLLTFGNSTNTCIQGTTIANDIARVRSDTTNGPTVNTDGIDADVNYHMTGVLDGALDVGGTISYVLHYHQDAFVYQGITVSPAYEAAGFTNYDRLPGTIPRWRGQFYADYSHGPHNLRITTNYTDGATDNRGPTVVQTGSNSGTGTAACSVVNMQAAIAGSVPPPVNCQLTTQGNVVGSFTSVDATYRLQLPWDTTLTLTVQNLFDQAPSAARLELSYDPFIGNALQRTFKIGIRHHF